MIRNLIALALVSTLAACAWNPQSVLITPQVDVAESTIGRNTPVRVSVVDERPQKTLGTRGVKGIGAELSIQGDLAAQIHDAIAAGMRRQGFGPEGQASGAQLRVEIRSFEYEVLQGFWAGTLNINITLKAICMRNELRPYENMHRGEYKESVQVVKSADRNNQLISSTVSQAVNSLLADAALMQCLSD